MSKIRLDDLKKFCIDALMKEGMSKEDAFTTAEVLAETDAFGVTSHGCKNLHGYIKKARAGGADLKARPELVRDGASYAVVDGHNALGMVTSVYAMDLACEKAEKTGIAFVVAKNSCHFGAAGYYSNMAAKKGMLGIAMSNGDPVMSTPGGRGKIICNAPFSFASPSESTPSVFLDIAMSNVAALKVIQAEKDGKKVPMTWITDADGLPTDDPTGFFENGALQPMGMHKGYGLAMLVECLTGLLVDRGSSTDGTIPSWCFDLEHPNNVTHAFFAINPAMFCDDADLKGRTEKMSQELRNSPKAVNATRIYTPGEIEWEKHRKAEKEGLTLSPDLEASLKGLSEDCGIALNLYE